MIKNEQTLLAALMLAPKGGKTCMSVWGMHLSLKAIYLYLQAPKGEKATGLERSTFALFMQPDWFASQITFKNFV